MTSGSGGRSMQPSTERRPNRRKKVLLTGIITYADGAHCFDCTIRDLSETGARLAVGKNAQFPSNFYLINIRDRVAYDAQLIWNDGAQIGISFKKPISLSHCADPSLSYLKRLWLSKATR